jgi:DNA helicase II / ATP-dependent DNA helicase PcrA
VSPALNDAQYRAVHHGDGPLLVLAGPGSGKTRVVTHRIARLLERGVPSTAVLSVTFTNKAAREMRERVRKLVGDRAKGLTVSTFHAACVRILREEIGALGWSRNFSIYDEGSQQSLLRAILRDMGGAGATASPSAVMAEINLVKSGLSGRHAPGPEGVDPAGASDAAARASFLVSARERYQEELRARNAIDFDDIILLTGRLFRERPEALERWRSRFRQVLVDEYQDTNSSQDEILQLLCAEHRNLCVVGDDDQSIYGWRGAEVEHILRFKERFPDATLVKLEQNYRSTGNVVAIANSVIAKNPKRLGKTVFTGSGRGEPVRIVELPDENEEAEWIAGEITLGIPPGANAWKAGRDFAVLFRTNEQMRPIEQALRQAKIPYRVLGGKSFFDRKEVLDVVAYLRLAANEQDDEAFFRIANVPSRGLGAGALQEIADGARERGVHPWVQAREIAAGERLAGAAGSALPGLRELHAACETVRTAAAARSGTLVTDLLAAIRYQAEVDRTYKDPGVRTARWNLAQEVQKAWESYLQDAAKPALAEFLDGITLRSHEEGDEDGGGVTLATMHASKGLEFPCVFVAGCEEGILPHSRSVDDPKSLEEERRLFYVAVTRAKARLCLSRPLTRNLRGRQSDTLPSRFLEGLPEDAVQHGISNEPAGKGAALDNVARMRAMLKGGSA